MKVIQKEFSHIRQKTEFTEDVTNMTLDMYYKKKVQPHVAPSGRRRRTQTPEPSWIRGFQRTHYYGPNYWTRKPPALLEQTHRLNELRRQIREVKDMIEYKVQVDIQQRLLEQLKIDIAQQEASKTDGLGGSQQRQPLVLMIGDEVLYDEDYQCDPLWKQVEEEVSSEPMEVD